MLVEAWHGLQPLSQRDADLVEGSARVGLLIDDVVGGDDGAAALAGAGSDGAQGVEGS